MIPPNNDHPDTELKAVLRRGTAEIGLFSVVINVLLLVTPLYLIQVYDRVLPSSSAETLIFLSIIALAALAFLGLLEGVRTIYAQRVAAVMDQKLASRAFIAATGSQRAAMGDIQPLNDLALLRTFIGSRGLTTLFDLPFIPVFLVLLFFIHPVLFWLTLAGATVLVLLMALGQAATRRMSAGGPERSARANLQAQAFVRNADTLRAMGMTRNAVETWGQQFSEALNQNAIGGNVNAGFSGLSRAIRMALQLAILGVGAWLVLAGQMTAGMIFASSIVAGRALQPLDQLIGGWPQIAEARHAIRRLRSALGRPAGAARIATTLPAPSGAIRVRNLVYAAPGSPPGAEPIIKRISFSVDAGASLAIIGPSRAGKSTLARLLVGAADPLSGSVAYDTADLRTWDPEQLGRQIGYLAQDVQLFPGTIGQNVSRFDPDACDAMVVAAAQRAHAHELISSQAEGYQTPIGASGHALSGGERQRIGLARAFYGEPRILVLDEPNANLDTDGEAALTRAMLDAKQAGATLVIVTHRLSVAASCDQVLMLRDGQIDAIGPAAEVLKRISANRNAPGQPAVATSALRFSTQGTVRQTGSQRQTSYESGS